MGMISDLKKRYNCDVPYMDKKLLGIVSKNESFKLCNPSTKRQIFFNDEEAVYLGLYNDCHILGDGGGVFYGAERIKLKTIKKDFPNLCKAMPNRMMTVKNVPGVIFFDDFGCAIISEEVFEDADNIIKELDPKVIVSSTVSLTYKNVKLKSNFYNGYFELYLKNEAKRWSKLYGYNIDLLPNTLQEMSDRLEQKQRKFDYKSCKIKIGNSFEYTKNGLRNLTRLSEIEDACPVRLTEDGLIKKDDKNPNAIKIKVSTFTADGIPKIILIYNKDLYYVKSNRIWNKQGLELSKSDYKLILKMLA